MSTTKETPVRKPCRRSERSARNKAGGQTETHCKTGKGTAVLSLADPAASRADSCVVGSPLISLDNPFHKRWVERLVDDLPQQKKMIECAEEVILEILLLESPDPIEDLTIFADFEEGFGESRLLCRLALRRLVAQAYIESRFTDGEFFWHLTASGYVRARELHPTKPRKRGVQRVGRKRPRRTMPTQREMEAYTLHFGSRSLSEIGEQMEISKSRAGVLVNSAKAILHPKARSVQAKQALPTGKRGQYSVPDNG